MTDDFDRPVLEADPAPTDHVRDHVIPEHCRADNEPWPCRAVLIAELEELQPNRIEPVPSWMGAGGLLGTDRPENRVPTPEERREFKLAELRRAYGIAPTPDTEERPGLRDLRREDARNREREAYDAGRLVGFEEGIEAATPPQADRGLREAAVQLREAAVKAGAHIVVTTDYPDGVKAFGILCDAIDVMDDALEALRDTPPAGLDAAWTEAEAALPEGWDLSLMSLRMHVKPTLDGPEVYAATASAPSDADHPYTRVLSSEEGRPRGSKHDATPAAALRALVARLDAEEPGS